ncbi:MAG: ribonuclease P protein component [Planctomycetota bacterium]
MKQLTFPKTKRLVTNKQFKAVLARNLRASNGLLTLFAAENDFGCARLGVSIGKSCGSSVVRNRLKRLIREAFRQNLRRIPPAFDYVVMMSPQAAKKTKKAPVKTSTSAHLTFDNIQTSLLNLANSAVEKNAKSSKRQSGASSTDIKGN